MVIQVEEPETRRPSSMRRDHRLNPVDEEVFPWQC
jgi:hypothetical protein